MMKTTSDMQQSFYEREIKETKLLPFDIHTHTHMSTPNGLFMIACLLNVKCT